MFAVGVFAGLRPGEIRSLQWGDVDFGSGLIHVRRSDDGPVKDGESRPVPLSPVLADVLLKWKEACRLPRTRRLRRASPAPDTTVPSDPPHLRRSLRLGWRLSKISSVPDSDRQRPSPRAQSARTSSAASVIGTPANFEIM